MRSAFALKKYKLSVSLSGHRTVIEIRSIKYSSTSLNDQIMATFNGSKNASVNNFGDFYTHATIYKTVLIILSVLIALSNATVLLLYHINPRIRSTKNLLLASLALSDLCAGTVVIPITLRCFGEYSWNICIASSILFRLIAFSTILHILAIIFEKYISILHPFWVVQKKHLRVVSGCIWTGCCVVAILPLAWLHVGFPTDPAFVRKELVYFLVTFVAIFFIPFILIVFAQVRMFRAISRSFSFNESFSTFSESPVESFNLTSRQSPVKSESDSIKEQGSYRISSTHNRKVLTAFALMLGTFTVCWLTWYVGIFLSYVHPENFLNFSADVHQMIQVLVFLPSLINPLLYTYYKQDFRQALQAFLKITLKIFCY